MAAVFEPSSSIRAMYRWYGRRFDRSAVALRRSLLTLAVRMCALTSRSVAATC
jgi:hypothetical protein